MKKIILKSLAVLSILTIMVLSITLNTNKIAQSEDVTITNLTALNTASAETYCLKCDNQIMYICWSDQVNGTFYGKRISLIPGPC